MQDDEIIRDIIGIPYKHGGRDMHGLDCWGLVCLIYSRLGIRIDEILSIYDETKSWGERSLFLENYHKQWITVEKPEVFDGVLFRNSRGVATHCGIIISNNRFIHCVKKVGVLITSFSNPRYSNKIEGYFRPNVKTC